MGIHSLNNAFNMAALWKTMKSGQPAKTVAPSKPVELTKNGSIFNSQNSQNTQKTQSQTTENSQTQSSGFSVGEGKAKAASAKGMMAQAKAGKAQTERNSSIMDKISAQSKTLQSNTQTSQKAMQAAMKTGQEKLDQNNTKMQKLTADMMREKAEIDAIQSRLESLTGGGIVGSGGSVYSLKLAGEEDPSGFGQVRGSGGGGGGNDSEIESLTAQLGSKQAKITVYSGKINKIQTSSGKAIRSMNKASRNYQSTVKRNQAQVQQNQAKIDDTYAVTDKINEIAMYTMLAGQGVKMFGEGMKMLGEKMVSSQNPATAAAGAAMITASVPIEETGSVVHTVGAYTSTAVSLTKSVIQMADGDVGGAMQSLMMATTTVSAAIQGTMEMASGFENIKKEADSAMQTGIEKQAAKALYKQNKKDGSALKNAGFTDKQIKQMAYQQTAGTMKNADANEIKAQLKANKNNAKGTNISMTDGVIAEGNSKMQASAVKLNDAKKSIDEFTPTDMKHRDKNVKKANKFIAGQIASGASDDNIKASLDGIKNSFSGNKGVAKSINASQSTASKAEKALKAIGASLMAAGTVAGITMALTQKGTTSTGKKEHHREGKSINIDVNHSYMKELAHRKRMARAEAAENRRG